MSDTFQKTDRTRLVRLKDRGHYDRDTAYAILDEGLICHVGFCIDAQPFVLPMAYARVDDVLLLHGSIASRLQRTLSGGAQVCICVTHLDGLVLARSAFHHSMNFRSLVAFGRAQSIDSDHDKATALTALVEHLVPGRSADARGPSAAELKATSVLEFRLEEASVKIRSGPPEDLERDLGLSVWAGEIPLVQRADAPVRSPDLSGDISEPGYVSGYRRSAR